MENLMEAIRAAVRDDAEPIARRAGLEACRKIVEVLAAATDSESAPPASAMPTNTAPGVPSAPTTVPNEPAAAPSAPTGTPSAPAAAPIAPAVAPAAPTTQASAPRIDPAEVATLVASLGKLPPEQLLDLAIARLRAALPAGANVPAPAPLRFQLVPLHHLRGGK